MRAVVTLVSPSPPALAAAVEAVVACARPVKARDALAETAVDLIIDTDDLEMLSKAIDAAVAPLPVDSCVQPAEGRVKRLLIADMDSTIIACECLDELAEYAGVKAEIAEVTERAMRGELAFEPALRARVARLKGLPLFALQRCYDERVRLNPGARTLIRTMAAHGARCVLVSGGFEFFTRRVAELAGFNDHRGNRLIDDGARLTGEVADPILGREAKLDALKSEAAVLGLGLDQTIAIGDGANDLSMILAAGLGVAYRAKPVVADQAKAKIDHADLTALLFFQGYRRGEFTTI
jgi:phosphoserine phosphatase